MNAENLKKTKVALRILAAVSLLFDEKSDINKVIIAGNGFIENQTDENETLFLAALNELRTDKDNEKETNFDNVMSMAVDYYLHAYMLTLGGLNDVDDPRAAESLKTLNNNMFNQLASALIEQQMLQV